MSRQSSSPVKKRKANDGFASNPIPSFSGSNDLVSSEIDPPAEEEVLFPMQFNHGGSSSNRLSIQDNSDTVADGDTSAVDSASSHPQRKKKKLTIEEYDKIQAIGNTSSKKSYIWKYYGRAPDNAESYICLGYRVNGALCHARFKHSNMNGTSSMNRHLTTNHGILKNSINKNNRTQTTLGPTNITTVRSEPSFSYDRSTLIEYLVAFITENNLDTAFVKSETFIRFVLLLKPGIEDDLEYAYKLINDIQFKSSKLPFMKKALKSGLNDPNVLISLHLDEWVYLNKNFTSVSAFLIGDSMDSASVLFSLKETQDLNDSGLREHIKSVLKEYGITNRNNNIKFLTTCQSFGNTDWTRALQSELNVNQNDQFANISDVLNVIIRGLTGVLSFYAKEDPNFALINNMAASIGDDTNYECDGERISNIEKSHRSPHLDDVFLSKIKAAAKLLSNAADDERDRFESSCEKNGIGADFSKTLELINTTPKKWEDCYPIMERACLVRSAITFFLKSRGEDQFIPSEDEWKKAQFLAKFFKTIHGILSDCSNSAMYSMHTIFMRIILEIRQAQSDSLENCGESSTLVEGLDSMESRAVDVYSVIEFNQLVITSAYLSPYHKLFLSEKQKSIAIANLKSKYGGTYTRAGFPSVVETHENEVSRSTILDKMSQFLPGHDCEYVQRNGMDSTFTEIDTIEKEIKKYEELCMLNINMKDDEFSKFWIYQKPTLPNLFNEAKISMMDLVSSVDDKLLSEWEFNGSPDSIKEYANVSPLESTLVLGNFFNEFNEYAVLEDLKTNQFTTLMDYKN